MTRTRSSATLVPSSRPARPGIGDHNGRENGLPRAYLRSCVLLLVAEAPIHGYEILAQLSELGLAQPDAGAVYRTLRRLDDDGLVESWWAASRAGPARRLYRITEAGVRCLEDLTAGLDQGHRHLSAYLERHRALTANHGGASPGGSPAHRSPEHVDSLFAMAASR